jgi:thiosulfate dehydrogenase [quinone] large subunit
MAGIDKYNSPAWIGDHAGVAVTKFLQSALGKTSGPHPDVSDWYAYFIEHWALHHTVLFSYMVTLGEILVGLALITGFCVGVSAFFGAFMNYNFLLAGTVSINPVMLLVSIFLMLAWRTAGWWGADRFILPQMKCPNVKPPSCSCRITDCKYNTGKAC